MAKSLKEMYGGDMLPPGSISKRKSHKINNQNGDSSDEAAFIDKQISVAPPMDKSGKALANDQAAKGNVHPNSLKGKNPESPDGVGEDSDYHTDDKEDAHDTAKAQLQRYNESAETNEELMVKMKAQTYHKDKGEWTQHVETGKVRGVSRKHVLDKALKKITSKHPDEHEHSAAILDKNEEWSNEAPTNPAKKGMWDGYSLEDLHKARAKASGTRLKEIDFAIRAKTGWGKVESVDDEFLDQIYEGAEYTIGDELNEADNMKLADQHWTIAGQHTAKEREAYKNSKANTPQAKIWMKIQDAHLALASHHDAMARSYMNEKGKK